MAVTLQDLRNLFYDILREEEDTSAYPLSLADLFINSAQQKIFFWFIENPFTKQVVRKGKIPFMQNDKFYSNSNVTTISTQPSVWDSELEVWSTDTFPNSWTLFIAGDILTYTSKTSTKFKWVSGIDFAHQTGLEVSIAFQIPSDFSSAINVTYNDNYKLPMEHYDDMFEDLNQFKWSWWRYNPNNQNYYYYSDIRVDPFYTIKDAQYLIIFNVNDANGKILLRYEKTPTNMSTASDNADITNDIYAKTTIPPLAVAEMLYYRWEEQRAKELYNHALWTIREMYSYYNHQSYENISWVAYWLPKSKYLNL